MQLKIKLNGIDGRHICGQSRLQILPLVPQGLFIVRWPQERLQRLAIVEEFAKLMHLAHDLSRDLEGIFTVDSCKDLAERLRSFILGADLLRDN
jgi:hypothetical protein